MSHYDNWLQTDPSDSDPCPSCSTSHADGPCTDDPPFDDRDPEEEADEEACEREETRQSGGDQ